MPQIPKTPTPFQGAPEYASDISGVFEKLAQTLFGGGPERAMDIVGGPMMSEIELGDQLIKMSNMSGVAPPVSESLDQLLRRLAYGELDPAAISHLEKMFFLKPRVNPYIGFVDTINSGLSPQDMLRKMSVDALYANKQLVPPGSYKGMPHRLALDPIEAGNRTLPHEWEHLTHRTSERPTEVYKLVESLYPEAKTGKMWLSGISDLLDALRSAPEIATHDLNNTFYNAIHYTNPNELIAEISGYKYSMPKLTPTIESPLAQWLRKGGFPVQEKLP